MGDRWQQCPLKTIPRAVHPLFPSIGISYVDNLPATIERSANYRSRRLLWPFLPKSSSTYLQSHPAVLGRPSDLSPGLDPEYLCPITPDQIGDGRSLLSLGSQGEDRT